MMYTRPDNIGSQEITVYVFCIVGQIDKFHIPRVQG